MMSAVGNRNSIVIRARRDCGKLSMKFYAVIARARDYVGAFSSLNGICAARAVESIVDRKPDNFNSGTCIDNLMNARVVDCVDAVRHFAEFNCASRESSSHLRGL